MVPHVKRGPRQFALVALVILTLFSCGLPTSLSYVQPTPSSPAVEPPVEAPAAEVSNPATHVSPEVVPTINYHAIAADANQATTAHVNSVLTNQGDSLWIFIAQEWATTSATISKVTDNKSEVYTNVLNYSSSGNSLEIWHVDNIPTGASYRSLQIAVTPTFSSNLTIAVIDLTHIVGSSPLDIAGTVNTGTGTTCSSSVTTTVANDIVLMGASAHANPTVAATGGDTKVDSSSAGNQITGGTFETGDASTGSLTSSCTLGTSETWASGSVAIEGQVVPNAPTSLHVSSETTTSVGLEWTQPAGTVTNNTIGWSKTGSAPWTWVSTGGPATSAIATPLSCDTNYYFTVTASNSSGTGAMETPIQQATTAGAGCIVYICNVASITTTLVYANITVDQDCGNVTVTTGSLTIDNVTWNIWQNNSGSHTDVSENHFLAMTSSSGHLTIKYSTIESGNGTAYPTYVSVTAGTLVVVHDHFFDLGAVTHPSNGVGFYVQTGHVNFYSDVFDDTYQLFFSSATAIGDALASSHFGSDESFNENSNGGIQCTSGCAHLNITNDTIDTHSANMISIYSTGQYTNVYDDTITSNVTGTGTTRGIYLAASGANAAQHSQIAHTSIQGGNIFISTQAATVGSVNSWYNVTNNVINSTGQGSGSGTFAIEVTGSGEASGTAGTFLSHLLVAHNTVTNCTRDAIRIDGNVTLFNVSYNSVKYPDGTGTADNNETTSIYIIRNVNNGTVYDNLEVLWNPIWIYTHSTCVGLESRVRFVNVSFNSCQNWTTGAFYNQGNTGADSAPKWLAGANLGNTFYMNEAREYRDITPSKDTTIQQDCFEDWSWANNSRWVDNTCVYVPGEYNHAAYYGTGIRVSSYNNTYIGNSITGAEYGVVIHRFSTSFENYPTYYLNQSYNIFINNTFHSIQGTVWTSDNSQGWPSSTNIIEGLAGLGNWNFTLVTASDTFWLGPTSVNLNYLNSSSPLYAVSHIYFHGTAILGSTGITYDFNLARYNVSVSTVEYQKLSMAGTTVGGGFYNVSITNYDPTTGSVNFTAARPGGTEYFNDTGAITGKTYSFFVDGVNEATQTASGGLVHFSWSSWPRHNFAIVDGNIVGVPPAPTNFHLVSATGATIEWAWTQATGGGIDNNTLYWKTLSGGTYTGVSLGTSVSYTLQLLPAATYIAFVTAWNATGQSVDSNTATGTTGGAPTIPPAPTGFHAVSDTTVSIDWSWTQSTGGGVLNDTIWWRATGSPTYAGISVGVVTSYNLTGLTPAVSYLAYVTSWNYTGQSNASGVGNATTGVPVCPSCLPTPGWLNVVIPVVLVSVPAMVIIGLVSKPRARPGGKKR
jgi:Fibronectin type III domain